MLVFRTEPIFVRIVFVSLWVLLSIGCQKGSRSVSRELQLEFLPTNGWPRGETTAIVRLKNPGQLPVEIRGWYTNLDYQPPNIDVYARRADSTNFGIVYDTSWLYNVEPLGSPVLIPPGQHIDLTTILVLGCSPGSYEFFATLKRDSNVRTPITVIEVLPGPDPPQRRK